MRQWLKILTFCAKRYIIRLTDSITLACKNFLVVLTRSLTWNTVIVIVIIKESGHQGYERVPRDWITVIASRTEKDITQSRGGRNNIEATMHKFQGHKIKSLLAFRAQHNDERSGTNYEVNGSFTIRRKDLDLLFQKRIHWFQLKKWTRKAWRLFQITCLFNNYSYKIRREEIVKWNQLGQWIFPFEVMLSQREASNS